MRIKYLLMASLGIVLAVSLTQIFPVWPSAGDIYPWYKSGYFSLKWIVSTERFPDAFVSIMMTSKPEYAWFFLDEISKKQNVTIHVYDAKGDCVKFPRRNRSPEPMRRY